MVGWLTWPADLLLSAGGVLAGWFASKGTQKLYRPSDRVRSSGVGGCCVPVCVSTSGYRIFAIAQVLDILPSSFSRHPDNFP